MYKNNLECFDLFWLIVKLKSICEKVSVNVDRVFYFSFFLFSCFARPNIVSTSTFAFLMISTPVGLPKVLCCFLLSYYLLQF